MLKRAAVLALFDHANHLGNHVAGALHQHRIADLHAEPLDFVFVVQRRARNRHAADIHRAQMRDRRQRAGAADLHVDILDHRLLLPRGELEGDGPARSLRRPAEPVLLLHGIDLGDHAVDFVGQRVALLLPFLAERDQRLDVAAQLAARVHLESHVLQACRAIPIAGSAGSAVANRKYGK